MINMDPVDAYDFNVDVTRAEADSIHVLDYPYTTISNMMLGELRRKYGQITVDAEGGFHPEHAELSAEERP